MRTTEAIHARLAAGDTTGVTRVHSAPDGPAGEIVTRGLFPPPSLAAAPRITLPSEDLVARLAQQHDLAEIADAVMLSFATGSEARIRATLAAHDNVSETLTDLVGQTRRLRQERSPTSSPGAPLRACRCVDLLAHAGGRPGKKGAPQACAAGTAPLSGT